MRRAMGKAESITSIINDYVGKVIGRSKLFHVGDLIIINIKYEEKVVFLL